jgi:hypothetical protein
MLWYLLFACGFKLYVTFCSSPSIYWLKSVLFELVELVDKLDYFFKF